MEEINPQINSSDIDISYFAANSGSSLGTQSKTPSVFNEITNLQTNEVTSKVYLKEDDTFQKGTKLGGFFQNGKSPKSVSSSDSPNETNIKSHKADNSIGLSFLPNQSKQFSHRKGAGFTLMVAGVAGTGKTTFINTLFGSNLINPTTGPITTTKITVNKFFLVEDGFQLNLNAIDTPGFGQLIDNQYAWVPIAKFIDEQFRLYLLQSAQPDRKKLVDSRVHCCLYFIAPSGKSITPLDIESMKELSKRVNLIPVISKSDTLSAKDLAKFKLIVKKTLEYENIAVCDLILDEQVNEKINSMVPFAIIGSNNCHINSENKNVRGRKYKWGIAEVENKDHCDFIHLRNILMSENMLDLITSTEAHYENYRQNCLHERFNQSLQLNKDSKFGNTTKNGIEQYEIYSKSPFSLLDDKLEEYDPVLENKERQMKENFGQMISVQERRFKEWKRALVEKQNSFNADIAKHHTQLVKLQQTIDNLENGIYIQHDKGSESSSYDDDTDGFTPIEAQSSHDSGLNFK